MSVVGDILLSTARWTAALTVGAVVWLGYFLLLVGWALLKRLLIFAISPLIFMSLAWLVVNLL